MKRKFLLWIILLTVLGLVACTRPQPSIPDDAQDATLVEATSTPTSEATPLPDVPEGRTVVADGQLASPYPNLTLGFSGGVSGQVQEIHVQAGDTVAEGDVLAVLDDTDLQRAVENAQLVLDRAKNDRARAVVQWERDIVDAEQAVINARRAISTTTLQDSYTNIEEARTALERARQAEADAKSEYETPLFEEWTPDDIKQRNYDNWQRAIRERQLAQMRLQDALDARAIRELDMQSRQSDLAQAERKLAALQDGIAPTYDRAVEDAERELAKAQQALVDARLKAPWPALVLSLNVAPKAQVSAGTPVVTLLSLEEGLRFITQNLSEQHVAALRPGQQAIVMLRTFPDTTLNGTVEAVIPQTEVQTTNDARFSVRVQLDATDLNLMPGLTGRVEILVAED